MNFVDLIVLYFGYNFFYLLFNQIKFSEKFIKKLNGQCEQFGGNIIEKYQIIQKSVGNMASQLMKGFQKSKKLNQTVNLDDFESKRIQQVQLYDSDDSSNKGTQKKDTRALTRSKVSNGKGEKQTNKVNESKIAQAIDIETLWREKQIQKAEKLKQLFSKKLGQKETDQQINKDPEQSKVAIRTEEAEKLKQLLFKKVQQNSQKQKYNRNVSKPEVKKQSVEVKNKQKPIEFRYLKDVQPVAKQRKQKKKQNTLQNLPNFCNLEEINLDQEEQSNKSDEESNLLDQQHPELQGERLEIMGKQPSFLAEKQKQLQKKIPAMQQRHKKSSVQHNQFEDIKKLLKWKKKVLSNVLEEQQKAKVRQKEKDDEKGKQNEANAEKANQQNKKPIGQEGQAAQVIQHQAQFRYIPIIFLYTKFMLSQPKKYLTNCHMTQVNHRMENKHIHRIMVITCLNYNLDNVPLLIAVWNQSVLEDRVQAYKQFLKKFNQLYGCYPKIIVAYLSQALMEARKQINEQEKAIKIDLFPSYDLRQHRNKNLIINVDPSYFTSPQAIQIVQRCWSAKTVRQFIPPKQRKTLIEALRNFVFGEDIETYHQSYREIQRIWKKLLRQNEELFQLVKNRYIKSNMRKTNFCEIKGKFIGLYILHYYDRQCVKLTASLMERKSKKLYHLMTSLVDRILSNQQRLELNINKKIDETPDYIERMRADEDYMIGHNMFELIRVMREAVVKKMKRQETNIEDRQFIFSKEYQVVVKQIDGKWKCSCNYMEVVGIPCLHLLKILVKKKVDWRTYIHEIYLKD